ncbi:glycosyltransferase family 4 protein [Actinomycetospora aeridis]|uniref:Glycosyltransferase family 4 protein n=1 Tax=Actinomycetospora aeridis TaxID=3129231 RepID=A0ABU8N6S8_9PSEU
MRTLVLTNRRLDSRQSGYDLRVVNLCAHLPGEVHLVVAPYQAPGTARRGLPVDGVFASVEELPPLQGRVTGWRRHLRLSNAHFLQITRPAAFDAARARLAEVVREKDISHLVVFGGDVAELAAGIDVPRTVLDVCDSTGLTARRALEGVTRRARWISDRVDVTRKSRTEARFPDHFGLVTAISDPDARAVEGGRHPAGTVRTIPNGIDEAYVGDLPPAGDRRGVVFWGNLAFGPNHEALWFFLHDVFLPHLRDKDVELCVIGGSPPSWLTDAAADEPLIRLAGYVEDLPSGVAPYPVMINPMRTGSGLKNKVLEAFALGRAVVTTRRGVEAMPEVRDGVHVLCADDAPGLADAVLAVLDEPARGEELRRAAHELVLAHYRWGVIGPRWSELVTTGM